MTAVREQLFTRSDVAFRAGGVDCAAWHYRSTATALQDGAGRPCVVMAHGFGGTRDSGLDEFAEAFSAVGTDVLLFDYRGFGSSGGSRRQLVDIAAQLEDYRSAVRHARSLDGVDAARVAVWGTSLSGGHVFEIAAQDQAIAAVIALTPATDARAAARAGANGSGRSDSVELPGSDRVASISFRDGRIYLPIVSPKGKGSGVPARGAYTAYRRIAGPTWENRFTITLRALAAFKSYHPGLSAKHVRCPVLVQIGDLDLSAPPLVASQAAKQLVAAEVHHYPCGHFDVYPGGSWHETVVRHQADFLVRHLSPGAVT